MESFFKIKAFKSLEEVIVFFFNIKNIKSRKKVMQPLNFKSHKKAMESFFGIKNFENRKKVTESFFSDYASLSFYTMHKFPGTIFFSVSSYWISLTMHVFLWLNTSLTIFLWPYILISMKKDAEHISVINYFTYVKQPSRVFYHTADQNIFENTGRRVLMLVMTTCGNFTFNWIFCVYSFS